MFKKYVSAFMLFIYQMFLLIFIVRGLGIIYQPGFNNQVSLMSHMNHIELIHLGKCTIRTYSANALINEDLRMRTDNRKKKTEWFCFNRTLTRTLTRTQISMA